MKKSTLRRFAPRLALALIAGALIPLPLVAQTDAVTTVVLVRHSETVGRDRDRPLGPDGRERAQTLAHVLGEVDVSAVYSTQYARTRQTAQPLAEHLGLQVSVVTATARYVRDMVQMIRQNHAGETIVIVSHSNTVPGIIAALGATPVPAIDEDEFDDLYIVTISSDGDAQVLNLRYGRESQ